MRRTGDRALGDVAVRRFGAHMAHDVPLLEAAVSALRTAPSAAPPVVVLDELLARPELERLVRWTLARREHFQPSQVISYEGDGGRRDERSRRSRVLYDVAPWDRVFAERVASVLDHVLARLGMPRFPVARFETQVTASNDGEFFRAHTDNHHERLTGRRLTYVFFFCREPAPFEGGRLRVFDGDAELAIAPRQNRVVFFPSGLLHEVAEVRCRSRAFEDSRFTVNGWLHAH